MDDLRTLVLEQGLALDELRRKYEKVKEYHTWYLDTRHGVSWDAARALEEQPRLRGTGGPVGSNGLPSLVHEGALLCHHCQNSPLVTAGVGGPIGEASYVTRGGRPFVMSVRREPRVFSKRVRLYLEGPTVSRQ